MTEELELLLVKAYLNTYPGEAARSLEEMPPLECGSVLNEVDPQLAAEVLGRMASSVALACLNAMTTLQAAGIMSRLPVATSANMLRRMGPGIRGAILEAISPKESQSIQRLIRFPEKTAGALMNPLAPTLPEDIAVHRARHLLQGLRHNVYYTIFVADRSHRLAGFLATWELFTAQPDDLLSSIMRRDGVRLSPLMEFQSLVVHPGWSQADELAVVDGQGLFLGAVQHRSVRAMLDLNGQPRPAESPLSAFLELGQLYSTAMHGLLQSLTSPPDSDRKTSPSGRGKDHG